MEIGELISRFHQGALAFRPTLRALIGHEKWFLHCQVVDGVKKPALWKNNNEFFLAAFTNEESLRSQLTGENTEDLETLQVDGMWLFRNLGAPINALIIDPGKPHSMQIPAKMFQETKKWSEAVEVEKVLSGEKREDNSLKIMLNFNGYCLPLITSESGKSHIALAPDNQGRKLAAVFTAPDNLYAYLDAAKDALGDNVVLDETDGEKLFTYLRDLNLDGVAFNCYGPTPPCAISLQMVNMIVNNS